MLYRWMKVNLDVGCMTLSGKVSGQMNEYQSLHASRLSWLSSSYSAFRYFAIAAVTFYLVLKNYPSWPQYVFNQGQSKSLFTRCTHTPTSAHSPAHPYLSALIPLTIRASPLHHNKF